MITSKQRAQLRGIGNTLDTILQIGKQGITDNLVKQAEDALLAREIIKMRVLETSPLTAREAARSLAGSVGADIVQVIGTRFILYRPNPEKPGIELNS